MDDFKKDLLKNLLSESIDNLKKELINMLFDKVDSRYFDLYLNSLSDNYFKKEIARLESKIENEINRIRTDYDRTYEISQIKNDLYKLLKKVENIEKKTLENKNESKDNLFSTQDVHLSPTFSTSQTYICPVTGMEFVFVKGGKFMMGDIWGNGDDDEKPAHQVELDAFYIAKYPVTQGQWKRVMGNNQSHFYNCGDRCPVDNISWYDAQEFIKRLNSMTDGKYRLPYEAEWEYSASWSGEGKKHKWAGTDYENELKDYAWYNNNSDNKTHLVGQKKPNILGLYDMSGNVWEWCMDWYDKNYYNYSLKKNPTGPNSGYYRVLRGGSYVVEPFLLRVACRNYFSPYYRGNSVGFRLVRTR